LQTLTSFTEEITGFFIIEAHVLNTTGTFRSAREVEELWDAIVERLSNALDVALKQETEAESFLRVKEDLMAFIMTLEVMTPIIVMCTANFY